MVGRGLMLIQFVWRSFEWSDSTLLLWMLAYMCFYAIIMIIIMIIIMRNEGIIGIAACLLIMPPLCILVTVLGILGIRRQMRREASRRKDIVAGMTYEDYLRLRSVYDTRERFQELIIRGKLQTASQEVLETLPSPTLAEATVVCHSVKEEHCCAFCMEAFVPQDNVSLLQCQHVFHSECIADWTSRPRATAYTCPLCRDCFEPTHV